jgi:hypothetical protein
MINCHYNTTPTGHQTPTSLTRSLFAIATMTNSLRELTALALLAFVAVMTMLVASVAAVDIDVLPMRIDNPTPRRLRRQALPPRR